MVVNFAPHFDYYRGINQLIWTCKLLRIMYGWVNMDVLQQKKMFPKIDGKGGGTLLIKMTFCNISHNMLTLEIFYG